MNNWTLELLLATSIIGAVFCNSGRKHQNEIDPVEYLHQFGYLLQNNNRHSLLFRDVPDANDIKLAIRRFQRVLGLNETGQMDGPTMEALSTPRCGYGDKKMVSKMVAAESSSNNSQSNYPSANYVMAAGMGWMDNNLTYSVDMNAVPSRVRRQVGRIFRILFRQWADASGLSIRAARSGEDASIKVSWQRGDHGDGKSFDGRGGVLGHAFFPNSLKQGEIHFDADERWNPNPGRGVASVKHVGLHEIGHSLGLDHSEDNRAVMYPYFPAFSKSRRAVLTNDDKAGIRTLYGSPQRRRTNHVDTATTTPAHSGSVDEPDRARERACDYLSSNHLNAMAYLFDMPEIALFTVGRLLYRVEHRGNYQPRLLSYALPNAGSKYAVPISSMLAMYDEIHANWVLYVFQYNIYWRYEIYTSIDWVPEDMLENTTALDELGIYSPPGYPKLIADGFAGITASDPIVFQLASDRLVYFVTSTHYWTWSPDQLSVSTMHRLDEHPILRGLPVKPPQLTAAVLSNDRNYFFASNGTFWTWLPPNHSSQDQVQGVSFDYYDPSDPLQASTRADRTEEGYWSAPLNTVRWIIQCR